MPDHGRARVPLRHGAPGRLTVAAAVPEEPTGRRVQRLCIGGVELRAVADCFGDHRVVEVSLPRGVRAEDLERVTCAGTRTVLKGLPRPLFRLDCGGAFLLTGIVGDARVRFTLRRAAVSRAEQVVARAVAELLGAS